MTFLIWKSIYIINPLSDNIFFNYQIEKTCLLSATEKLYIIFTFQVFISYFFWRGQEYISYFKFNLEDIVFRKQKPQT